MGPKDQSVLAPLADAIADLVWHRLQDRLEGRAQSNLMNVPSVAKRLGISRTKVYQMIATGELPATVVRRIGRRTLIASCELDRWIAAR